MTDPSAWPSGDSEMAARILAFDWAATPLGPSEQWPERLRAAVDLILPAGFPMIVLWGDALIQIYNDGYCALMGNKHPAGLGRPTRESWPEVWPINAPIYDRVRRGESLTFEDSLYPITRSGRLEDAWFTLSYSPLRDAAGAVAGVLVAVTETTDRVRESARRDAAEAALRESEERLAFLLSLADTLRPLTDAGEIERQATRLLGEHLQADRCFLSPVYDDGSGMCVREEYLRSGASSVLGDYTFAQFGDFVGPELHAGRILAVENVSALAGLSAAERASYAAVGIEAYLLVPVTRDGRLAAFLTINHRTPRSWSDADKAVARQTADRLWTARERARVETALRESEEMRRVALAGGRMGTWRWNLDAQLVWGDAQFMALYGLPPTDDAVPLALFTERMSPDSAAEIELIVSRAITAGEEFDGPIQIASGPTAGRWVQWRGRTAPGDVTTLQGVTFDITERKEADVLVRESEERLQRVLDTAAVGVLFFNSEGYLTDANDAFLAMTGYTRESVGAGALHWRDMTPPEWLAVSEAQMEQFAITGRVGPYEKEYFRADGTRRWMLFAGRDLGDGSIAEFAVDITDRRRAEDALRESEERFREFGENSSDALWIVDAESMRLVYLSPAFERIWGESRDAVLADISRWAELVHPDDREVAAQAMPHSLAGRAHVVDYRILRPDGDVRWIRDTGFPMHQDGVVKRIGGIAQDVTDLKKAEELAGDREERLRLIVENARDYAIFTLDADGIVTDWREGAKTVFGWTREEMMGRDGSVLWTAEDRSNGEPEQEMRTAREAGRAPDVRWHCRKDGSPVFIEGVMTLLGRGGAGGFLKVGRDATERYRAEERQRILLAELQHRVRNTLGVIRSIARRSAQNSDTVEELGAHLDGRIEAFARVQAMVTRKPDSGVDLTVLIEDELIAHAARGGEQVQVQGPPLTLTAKAAETLSLALHELTTNAVKYGALTGPHGRLRVAWATDAGRLALSWVETRVALSGEPPDREGFGFELLRRVVPYDLRAETRLDFTPDGLHFTLDMPLEGNVA